MTLATMVMPPSLYHSELECEWHIDDAIAIDFIDIIVVGRRSVVDGVSCSENGGKKI